MRMIIVCFKSAQHVEDERIDTNKRNFTIRLSHVLPTNQTEYRECEEILEMANRSSKL